MGYYTAIHEIWSRLGDSYSEYENFKHWTDDQVREICQKNYNSVLHGLQTKYAYHRVMQYTPESQRPTFQVVSSPDRTQDKQVQTRPQMVCKQWTQAQLVGTLFHHQLSPVGP